MIYGKLMGGLGNQLFIYAFCKKIVNDLDCDAKLIFPESYRKLGINNFNLDHRITVESGVFDEKFDDYRNYIKGYELIRKRFPFLSNFYFRKVEKRGILYDIDDAHQIDFSSLYKNKNIYFCGYMQKKEYAENLRCELLREIDCPLNDYDDKLESMRKENSVCVHIRLGDYTSDLFRERYFVCKEAYFENAMNKMSQFVPNAKFYVFSDDIEQVKNNYMFIRNYDHEYVDSGNDVVKDFILMKNCRHFIISNSSLSWWAQFLGNYENKRVIAPSRWENGLCDKRALYQDDWFILEV